MGTAKDIKTASYCDEVLAELAYMIQNINDLRGEVKRVYGPDSEVSRAHEKHLGELSEYIDWKLQILTTACPFTWKGMGEGVESVVSVQQPEVAASPDFSGGYVGG
jgi:hypothetical protein